mmetsp:Transcript_28239/g.43937  ORF Transcript_28239/g.43937 Transcript_28239/m.43937 type:complete len:723 (-) Transcript_28239:367-2535(-)
MQQDEDQPAPEDVYNRLYNLSKSKVKAQRLKEALQTSRPRTGADADGRMNMTHGYNTSTEAPALRHDDPRPDARLALRSNTNDQAPSASDGRLVLISPSTSSGMNDNRQHDNRPWYEATTPRTFRKTLDYCNASVDEHRTGKVSVSRSNEDEIMVRNARRSSLGHGGGGVVATVEELNMLSMKCLPDTEEDEARIMQRAAIIDDDDVVDSSKEMKSIDRLSEELIRNLNDAASSIEASSNIVAQQLDRVVNEEGTAADAEEMDFDIDSSFVHSGGGGSNSGDGGSSSSFDFDISSSFDVPDFDLDADSSSQIEGKNRDGDGDDKVYHPMTMDSPLVLKKNDVLDHASSSTPSSNHDDPVFVPSMNSEKDNDVMEEVEKLPSHASIEIPNTHPRGVSQNVNETTSPDQNANYHTGQANLASYASTFATVMALARDNTPAASVGTATVVMHGNDVEKLRMRMAVEDSSDDSDEDLISAASSVSSLHMSDMNSTIPWSVETRRRSRKSLPPKYKSPTKLRSSSAKRMRNVKPTSRMLLFEDADDEKSLFSPRMSKNIDNSADIIKKDLPSPSKREDYSFIMDKVNQPMSPNVKALLKKLNADEPVHALDLLENMKRGVGHQSHLFVADALRTTVVMGLFLVFVSIKDRMFLIKFTGSFVLCCLSTITTSTKGEPENKNEMYWPFAKIPLRYSDEIFFSRKSMLLAFYVLGWAHLCDAVCQFSNSV